MDEVRKLVTDKLAEKGLTMKDVSLQMGHAHSYLYQFQKRGIPTEIHERDRAKLAAILGVSEDSLRGSNNPGPPSLDGRPDNPPPVRTNRGSQVIGADKLLDRCRDYERALRKIVDEEPNTRAAKIAAAALLLFE
jgi:hypothetical protein